MTAPPPPGEPRAGAGEPEPPIELSSSRRKARPRCSARNACSMRSWRSPTAAPCSASRTSPSGSTAESAPADSGLTYDDKNSTGVHRMNRAALLSLAALLPLTAISAQTFKVQKFDIGADGGTDYLTAEPGSGRVFV